MIFLRRFYKTNDTVSFIIINILIRYSIVSISTYIYNFQSQIFNSLIFLHQFLSFNNSQFTLSVYRNLIDMILNLAHYR